MGLNIVAHRRFSLAEFAEGWDDCYLTVKVASKELKEEWEEKSKQKLPDDEVDVAMRQMASQVIVGGVVITTEESGSKPVKIEPEDIPTVIDALGFAWLAEIISVSTGADRLKALKT